MLPWRLCIQPRVVFCSQILRGKSKLGTAGGIGEDDELGLEEDVPKDGLADPAVALETAEAAAAAVRDGGVVEVAARRNGRVSCDGGGEVGKGRGAVEDVTTVLLAVCRTTDLAVVSAHDVVGEKEERSSGISDGGDVLRYGCARANLIAARREPPEALRVIDIGVSDVTRVLGAVDVAKVVASWLTLLQVGREKRRVQRRLSVGEEGLGLIGGNSVDRTESKTQQTITLILGKLGADGLGQLDVLPSDRSATNIHRVSVDIATG